MVTKRDIITQYFFRNPTLKITTKELARVLSMNYNTTRYYVWKLKHDKLIEKSTRKSDKKTIYNYREIAEKFVKKYLSSILYCGTTNSHHGKKVTAYAYTFEEYDQKSIDRSEDLYEEIRRYNKNCFEIYIDELDQFGKNYGYGIEPTRRIQREYIYPRVYVSVNGQKVSF